MKNVEPVSAFNGKVTSALPNTMFRVELDDGRILLTTLTGKMRKNYIRIFPGDRVKIDSNKYPISCDISIYKDRVRISILGKRLSGIFIRSKDFAETLKSLFKLAFDNLNK